MKSPPTNINLHTDAKLMVLLSNTCTVGMIAEEVTNSWLPWQSQCCCNNHNKMQVFT